SSILTAKLAASTGWPLARKSSPWSPSTIHEQIPGDCESFAGSMGVGRSARGGRASRVGSERQLEVETRPAEWAAERAQAHAEGRRREAQGRSGLAGRRQGGNQGRTVPRG